MKPTWYKCYKLDDKGVHEGAVARKSEDMFVVVIFGKSQPNKWTCDSASCMTSVEARLAGVVTQRDNKGRMIELDFARRPLAQRTAAGLFD